MRKINTLFKRLALWAIGCTFPLFAFGQIEINSEAGLRAIADDLNGNYKLTADITLTESWVPIGTKHDAGNAFKGTLDGNGHVIYNLKFNNTSDGNANIGKGRYAGLFGGTDGATIKNLGIENASVVGFKQVGGIVGIMRGGVIENCYVTNSYVESEDHVGAIAGQIHTGAVVQNCYSNANVYSRSSQAGGLVGVINNTDTKISKCYFSGIIRSKNARPSAIVSYVDHETPTVEYSVNLAPYILGPSNLRIAGGDKARTLIDNYSLSLSKTDSNSDNFGTQNTVPTSDGNYGTDKRHGANIPGGDANAQNQAFYTNGEGIDGFSGLGWDFENTWKMTDAGYPILKWQQTPVNFAIIRNLKSVYSLKNGGELDFADLLPNQPFGLKFETTSEKVDINGSKVTIKGGVTITVPEFIEVSIHSTVSDNFVCIDKINIALVTDEAIHISTADDLNFITAYPTGSFILDNDIDMSGVEFNGLCSTDAPFKGTFDGNGKIISNFTINTNRERVGLFNYTNGATIKKLGVEGAYVKGAKRVGVIIGEMHGGTLEESYVADSYSESSDHVGALVGTGYDDAKIMNCYANSKVYTSNNQSGGIIGVVNNTVIEKCYFAGLVEAKSDRAQGIVGLVDANDADRTAVRNSVNLAPALICNNVEKLFRIIDTGSKGGALANNYSLATTVLGTSLSTATIRTSDDATSKDGKDLSVEKSKSQSFYQATLGWDFTDETGIWKMEGGYPILAWQQTPINTKIVDLKESYSLKDGENLDFAQLLNSAHGLTFTFAKESGPINVTLAGVVTPSAGVFPPVDAYVTVTPPAGYTLLNNRIKVELFPAGVVEISEVDKFMLIAQYPDMDYKLVADIDLTGKEFNGIGTSAKPYTGTFDGNGYIVKGFNSEITADEVGAGLFRVTDGATIRNLGVEFANVVMAANKKSAGIIIGEMNGGTLEACYTANSYVEGYDHAGGLVGSVYGGTLKNSYSTASVYSRAHQAGGIVGAIKGGSTIENCYFSGFAMNRADRVVGLGGYHDGGTGAVTVTGSAVLTPFLFSGNNGAMYRIFDNGNNTDRLMALSNNYALGNMQLGRPDLSELRSALDVGADKRDGQDVAAADAKTESFYRDDLGWDMDNTWVLLADAYPVLKWQVGRSDKIQSSIYAVKSDYFMNDVDGAEIDLAAYVFSSNGLALNFSTTSTDMVSIANGKVSVTGENIEPKTEVKITPNVVETANFKNVSGDDISILLYPAQIEIKTPEDMLMLSGNLSGNYILKNDITLTEAWTPVATFTGTFNGNGKTISGLTYDQTGNNDAGLFGKTKGAVIKNLGIKASTIKGHDAVGAIVGAMSGGSIDQCYIATDCYVEGRQDVGALVGIAADGATITNSYALAEVRARDQEAGGILGSIKDATVENCYFAGEASSWRNVAGIVGRADADGGTVQKTVTLADKISSNDSDPFRVINTKEKAVTLVDNYSLSSTKVVKNGAEATVPTADANYGTDKMHGANITGSDDAAKTSAFYSSLGWDFLSVWQIIEGETFPALVVFGPMPGTEVADNADNGYSLFVDNGCLYINGLSDGANVSIYNISGQLVMAKTVSGELQYNLPAKGLYIVNITQNGVTNAVKLLNK